MKKFKHIFLSGLIAIFLGSTLLIGNAFQLLTLVIYPVSKALFFHANRQIANEWWGLCVWIAGKIHKNPVRFSGDELNKDENGLIIVNHQSMADIPVLFELVARPKRLGDLKWFIKDIIKWFPGVGWGLMFLNSVFVKRDWKKDVNRISKAFQGLVHNKIPFYLVLFPEGTRLRPSKIIESARFANKHNLPVMSKVLLPRTKGFLATIEGLRNHINAVYDVTIMYEKNKPTLWQWFTHDPGPVHVFVKRYAMDDLPNDPEGLSVWLIQRYQEKDELLTGAVTESRP